MTQTEHRNLCVGWNDQVNMLNKRTTDEGSRFKPESEEPFALPMLNILFRLGLVLAGGRQLEQIPSVSQINYAQVATTVKISPEQCLSAWLAICYLYLVTSQWRFLYVMVSYMRFLWSSLRWRVFSVFKKSFWAQILHFASKGLRFTSPSRCSPVFQPCCSRDADK